MYFSEDKFTTANYVKFGLQADSFGTIPSNEPLLYSTSPCTSCLCFTFHNANHVTYERPLNYVSKGFTTTEGLFILLQEYLMDLLWS
jgi:hypothetical protein